MIPLPMTPASIQSPEQPPGPCSILVVDDEPGLRLGLAGCLELAGYRVVEACDGEEALQKIRASAFDAVITDIRMPGLDGVEAFRRIKQLRPTTVVIMMTAFAVEDLVEDGLNEGAYTIMHKPFEMEHLLHVVTRALKRRVILVVDDESQDAASLVAALTAVGLRAQAVHDGESAIALAERDAVDVFVLDLVMPGLDGVETFTKLKQFDPSVSVIGMTGHAVSDLIHRILAQGSYLCLHKPFAMRELVHAIAHARGHRA
jgi:DNA-binding NtrC family response regulator